MSRQLGTAAAEAASRGHVTASRDAKSEAITSAKSVSARRPSPRTGYGTNHRPAVWVPIEA